MPKTPSPKVIAAYVLREIVTNARQNFSAEDMATLVSSRVSPEKRAKVLDQFQKLVGKIEERAEKTIGKFENPAPKPKKE